MSNRLIPPLAPAPAKRVRAGAAKPARRSQGRPNAGGAKIGREALIAATRELLRTEPPARLSRLKIARFAGVDPSLIRYYFGDVQRLLAEVAIDITGEMRANVAREAGSVSLAEGVRRRVARTVQMFVENPHLHSIVRDLIFSGRNPTARTGWREIIERSVAELDRLLREGERSGGFRYVEPRYLHLVIIGACEFFVSGKALLEDMFGPGDKAGRDADRFAAFLTDQIVSSLRRR